MAKKSGKTKRRAASTKKPANNSLASSQKRYASSVSQDRRLKVKPKLDNVIKLSKQAGLVVWQNKRLFISLSLIYGLLNLILVQGLSSSTDVASLKSQFNKVFTGNLGSITSGLSIFATLVSSAGNGSSQTAGAYQIFLGIISSLAIIWSLRQVMSSHNIRLRDAYYSSMYPLIPFILVLLVILVQLIPLIVGAGLYSTVIGNSIAVGAFEKLIWLFVFIVLAAWSLYMLSSSLFAIYIVTLPDMTPLKALRSAKKLVHKRRLRILLKILAMPIILLVIALVIMLPIILWLTALSQWVFFLLTTLAIVAIHSYMYTLYRELLNE